MVYILAVVEEYMIFDTDPLCGMEKPWPLYHDNIVSKFTVYACVKLSIKSFLHITFINSVTKGGQDD